MNKKQLTESIMAGVKRAFRENKSLNEGFSAWREENAPKFPIETFNKNIEPLINLLSKYVEKGYFVNLSFGILINDGYKVLKSKNNSASLKPIGFVIDGEDILKAKCEAGEDQFNRAMYLTKFRMVINKDTMFEKYVKTTINGGSNKIIDYEDLIEVTNLNQDDQLMFTISSKDLLNEDNVNKIIECEVGIVFEKVLECAGVYKCTEEGRRSFEKFILSI
jgi:hypothetical protein